VGGPHFDTILVTKYKMNPSIFMVKNEPLNCATNFYSTPTFTSFFFISCEKKTTLFLVALHNFELRNKKNYVIFLVPEIGHLQVHNSCFPPLVTDVRFLRKTRVNIFLRVNREATVSFFQCHPFENGMNFGRPHEIFENEVIWTVEFSTLLREGEKKGPRSYKIFCGDIGI